mgnify:CR=1 FL=1
MWAMLGKQLLKGGAKKVATNKLLNRKKKTNKRRASVKKIMGGDEEGRGKQKGGALAIRPTMGLVPVDPVDPISTTPGESDVVIIKKQVIQVRDILKDTHSAKQVERRNLRKALEAEKRKEREEKVEKPKVKPKESKGMKMPKLGGGIGNFLSWLVFGLVVNKLLELLPALKKIFGILKPIANFIGGLFNTVMGLVTGFIDLAYAGVENLEKAIGFIGGEGPKKLFERFGKLFTQVLNGALIAALVAARVGAFNRKPRISTKPGGKPGKTPLTAKNFKRELKIIKNKYGNNGKRLYNQYRQQGMSQSEALKRVKRVASKNPSAFKSTQPKWQKDLKKKWKESKPRKFLKTQKQRFSNLKNQFKKSPVGRLSKNISKTAEKLRPKNVGDWIKKGGPDKVLKNTFKKTSQLITKGGNFLKKQTPGISKKLSTRANQIGGSLRKNIPGISKKLSTGVNQITGKLGGTLGKTSKILGKLGSKIKIPIIGPLIVATISIISGEGIGKAAFRGIGAALGGILGNFIPIPVVGMLVGEGIGLFVGDLLYEGFLGKGWGAAGTKLKDSLAGIVTGAGKVGKAMVEWIFGGGLINLLKNVGGGALRFINYLFGGGLLIDIFKGTAGAAKVITNFIFGGGLFKLIGGVAGLPLKMAKWMLMTALPWAFKKAGGVMVAGKEWVERGVSNLIVNFPTVPIPDINPGEILSNIFSKVPLINKVLDLEIPGVPKWLLKPLPIPKAWKEVLNKGFSIKTMLEGLPGIQEFLGFFAQHIPVLKNWVEGGKLTKLPNLLFLTPLGMPFLMPTIAKSFFPGSTKDTSTGTQGSNTMMSLSGGGMQMTPEEEREERFEEFEKNLSSSIISSNTSSKAEGLDTHPSYAQGGLIVIDNNTTIIQPIEVG